MEVELLRAPLDAVILVGPFTQAVLWVWHLGTFLLGVLS